jgi:hypothetical protein
MNLTSKARAFLAPFLFLMFLLSACDALAAKLIPDGTYADGAGNSFVVAGDKLTLSMKMNGHGYENYYFSQTLGYELGSKGRLALKGSSDSDAFLDIVTMYTWDWDGATIVQTTVDTSVVTYYQRKEGWTDEGKK